ncbi:hypothetical protein [Candidatus Rhodobacter oscarellae]|uniref:hypothetical protein n=1 Tax=Candidatus Rhodobacter oscarellae TaxID=1675527 RepID=UPI00067146B1|nr:hypothetical protein [Candidatus Rhodobacter lobularis]
MIKKLSTYIPEIIPARTLQFITDCFMVLVEAIIVLLIVHVPLVLSLIYKKIGSEGTSIVETVFESYQVGDVLGYVAGLLASSTAYFFVRFRYARYKPYTMAVVAFSPVILIFFAAPVFFRDLDGNISTGTFTNNYIIGLLAFAAAIWLFSLYQQKAISRISGDSGADDLMKRVHRPK